MAKPWILWGFPRIALRHIYAQKAWRSILAMTLMTTFAITAPSRATTWRIQADGQGDAPTVQAGIDSSVSGDTVLVAPGTYFEDIDFLGRDIILLARDGASATVLDGTGQDSSVVILRSGETRAAVVEGFTITNGAGTPYLASSREGGGIFCPNASPTIRKNRIVKNRAEWGGGVLAGKQSSEGPFPSPLIESNLIEDNFSEHGGGGIVLFRSHAVIKDNTFRSNEGRQGDGGGLDVILYAGTCEVVQNEFWSNTAGDQGGGILAVTDVGAGPVLIERNLVVGNLARGGSPDVLLNGAGGGIAIWDLNGTVRNNTIVRNSSLPAGSCTGGGLRILGGNSTLQIAFNIIAENTNCGVVCRQGTNATFGPNLVWNNSQNDLGECPPNWISNVVVENPFFCDPENGTFSVALNSPALSGPQPMGAFTEPGCGSVSIEVTTWGQVKAMFLRQEGRKLVRK